MDTSYFSTGEDARKEEGVIVYIYSAYVDNNPLQLPFVRMVLIPFEAPGCFS